jgi:hypothetical protein
MCAISFSAGVSTSGKRTRIGAVLSGCSFNFFFFCWIFDVVNYRTISFSAGVSNIGKGTCTALFFNLY